MNFKTNTAEAITAPLMPMGNQPPLLVMLSMLQWPLVNRLPETMREMMIMLKKKIVDRVPVREMLKLERMYHRIMMPMAMYLE